MVKKNRKFVKIEVGNIAYEFPDLEGSTIYRINPNLFKSVRSSIVTKIIKEDLVPLIYEGHMLIGEKKIPEQFDSNGIKEDMLESEKIHSRYVQKEYLKKSRAYWEERYSFDELIWFQDFIDIFCEFEGRVGVEWLRLFEIVRGPLPQDFPDSIAYSVMICNVLYRKMEKYKSKLIKKYFHENEEAIKQICNMRIPDDLPVDEKLGITTKDFVKHVKHIADEKGIFNLSQTST